MNIIIQVYSISFFSWIIITEKKHLLLLEYNFSSSFKKKKYWDLIEIYKEQFLDTFHLSGLSVFFLVTLILGGLNHYAHYIDINNLVYCTYMFLHL